MKACLNSRRRVAFLQMLVSVRLVRTRYSGSFDRCHRYGSLM